MIWLRYVLLVLMAPAYIIALSRRRWTTMPLWLVSTLVMLTQSAMSAQQGTIAGVGPQTSPLLCVAEMTKIMIIPIAVQLAVLLKGWQARAGINQADRSPAELVATFNVGEL